MEDVMRKCTESDAYLRASYTLKGPIHSKLNGAD